MIVALIIILVAVGSVIFHFMSPWWWTPIASNWGFIDTTILITFWVTGVVFVAVVVFTGWCVWKYRYDPNRRSEYEPENHKLEFWLTVATTVGVAVMLAPGLIAWDEYITVPDDAVDIEVLGQQWQWNFRLPGEDGKLGKTSIRFVDGDNTFGIDPNDPAGRDDILIEADDLHMPVDQPTRFLLRSLDVLHDFYVPQFRAKMDMIPGMVTYFWVTPTVAGEYEILCAELCGSGHHAMRGRVVVDSAEDYAAWLAEQESFEQLMADAGVDLKPVQLAAAE